MRGLFITARRGQHYVGGQPGEGGQSLKTRPSALGKSDPFCGPSNP